MPTKNTETASFRLDSYNLNKLKKEADDDELSLNQLLNKVIGDYVNFRSVAKSAGFMSIPKPVLIRMMKKFSEEDAKKVGKEHYEKDGESILYMLRNNYSVDDFVDTIEYWVKDSGFSFRHDIENEVHKYAIHHDLGKNWSLYMSEFICGTIEKMIERKVDSKITGNMFAFSFDKSKVIEKYESQETEHL